MKLKTYALTTIAAAAIAAGVLYGCGGGSDDTVDATQGVVIQNATVVDTRDGSLHPGMALLLNAGKIQKIVPNSSVRLSGTAQAVDATGKYVVPGFLDMHTHLFNASVISAAEMTSIEKLLVANGITGIREMGGFPAWLAMAAQLNAARAAGTVDTPEILEMPGRIVGIPPTNIPPFDVGAPVAAANSASGAVAEVQAQKGYGAGFIKTISASHDALLALINEGKNQGLGVAGHLNPALAARDASAAGWHVVEHLGGGQGELLDCSTQEATIRANLLSVPSFPVPTWSANPAVYQSIADTYDASKCQALAQTFAQNGTWQVPTLIRLRTMEFLEDAAYLNDPNLIYVSKTTRAAWTAAAAARQAAPQSTLNTLHQYYGLQQNMPLLFKQAGVKMLAGSDMSINPILTANWVIPGFSLHQEFALLAASGLTPLDILQMTTLNAAQYLNRLSTMGTVDAGKNADLVLLDANPIASVSNLDKIAGVVLNGKYFPKTTLDQMKADVAAAYAAASSTAPNATIQSIKSLQLNHID